MTFTRVPTRRYEDPLDAIWLATARALGLRVRRSPEAYASTDGRGTLVLGEEASLDPDDGLAQMIFHEFCHALVQGEDAFSKPDWGLDNTSDRDAVREHATLRLQAFLSARHGLRKVLAPTTDYRAWWDDLDDEPLLPRHDPAVVLAILGARRAEQAPWSPHLHEALRATAVIAGQAASFTRQRLGQGSEAEDRGEGLPSSWLDVEEPPGLHATGLPLLPSSRGRTCGDCAWRIEGRGARRISRCRQANDARVSPEMPACERWEPALDCLTCGACCRSAYDMVMTSLRDPFVRKHPDLVVLREDHGQVKRSGDRCAALQGGPQGDTLEGFQPWTCRVYEDRPRTCREFEMQGMHCLLARRRVGLSP